jgi:UDP-N-acetylmuramyl pentapeptide synthase
MKPLFKKIITAILTAEAKAVIRKYSPKVIAVTGSMGKTSTKDAIYDFISKETFVRKSEKSFNSEIGVPLTILGCQNGWNSPTLWAKNIWQGFALIFPLFAGKKIDYPKCLILEVGADHPGDIQNLVKWLKPDVAVITAVSKIPVHVEFFASPAEVLNEKLYLARAVKASGVLVLPANDPEILAVRKETPELGAVKCITFGVDATADISLTAGEIWYEEGKATGMQFKINAEGNSIPSRIRRVLGKQFLFAVAAGIGAARAYGTSLSAISNAVPSYDAPRGRMNILEGVQGTTIIDDSYNASPDAVTEALNVLKDVSGGRKIAVIGDMMELGTFSVEQHTRVGAKVAEIKCDILVTAGVRARNIALGAHEAGMPLEHITSFDTSVEAAVFVQSLVKAGDIILVKGSQSPRMERVSKALLADPTRAGELLVRQESEWENR